MKLRHLGIAAAALVAAGPSFGQPAMGERAVGGLSRCENLIGLERDQCLQLAEGPGTRIRATPSGPGAPVQSPPGPADRDAQRCEAMHQEAKDRCMRELRAAQRDPTLPPHAGPSPETSSPGTAASSGASSGAGGGAFSAPAPR